ncbi:MAG: hypothetical protein ACTH3R_10730, partial [Brevibacterium aurantiacum]|uniref:hypothetical protein n=1 Tax=Brevibacterium aurantiacum TaxID=273384 RepID=UPI003F922A7E
MPPCSSGFSCDSGSGAEAHHERRDDRIHDLPDDESLGAGEDNHVLERPVEDGDAWDHADEATDRVDEATDHADDEATDRVSVGADRRTASAIFRLFGDCQGQVALLVD